MWETHAIVITDFEISTLITKSTEPCTTAKLGYFSQIDVDTDCLNRIQKFKIPLKANEPCFWITYKILVRLCQIVQKKNQAVGGTLFWLTLYFWRVIWSAERTDYFSLSVGSRHWMYLPFLPSCSRQLFGMYRRMQACLLATRYYMYRIPGFRRAV